MYADGPGYQEKFYFNTSNTGFKVLETLYITIGIGIRWDQWFPKCTGLLALLGAELILYSTAIRSKPHSPNLNSRGHWIRVMQGHAGLNLVPVVCSNCIGRDGNVTFYGKSFILDQMEMLIEHFGSRDNVYGTQTDAEYLIHTFNLADVARRCMGGGVFCNCHPKL
jgi:N-carbamoylputrescine amidase